MKKLVHLCNRKYGEMSHLREIDERRDFKTFDGDTKLTGIHWGGVITSSGVKLVTKLVEALLRSSGNLVGEVCYDEMNKIDKELSIMFKNANREDKGTNVHRGDPTGNSYITSIYYYLKDGGGVRVACFDWSDKLYEEKNWQDHIKVSIFTEEILDWFTYEAYK